mgnify:FL=1
MHDLDLFAVAELIAGAKRLVVLTGAGISTDSGIPDFRGPDGIWTKDPDAERLSTIDYFMSSSAARTKHWWNEFYINLTSFEPNDGHRAIAALKPRTIITQNIDGLHQRAGSISVLEMHGTVHTSSCTDCGKSFKTENVLFAMLMGRTNDPHCDEGGCEGVVKRDIVMFGEDLNPQVWSAAESAATSADVMLCVGSTLSVFPVAALPGVTKEMGGKVVIVNDGRTEFDSRAAYVLRGSASDILSQLVKVIQTNGC